MKQLFGATILWSIIFANIATVTQAQNNSACFMLDADGNSIDLGHLCQSNIIKNNRTRRNISNPTQSVRKSGVYVVPIKGRRSGIPVIDVKFNDRYTFEMMLDTGASGIVITEQMAKVLKVHHTETVLVSTPSNNYFKMPAGYVYSVEVGKLTQKNSHVITSSSMDMGLLGQSFFSQYDLTIKSDVVEFRER